MTQFDNAAVGASEHRSEERARSGATAGPPQFDNVSVTKRANIYFDGKCVSHSLVLPDGTRKSVGVIFPAELVFSTAAPEVMEINAGTCKVRLDGADEWIEYSAGESFEVPGDSKFDIHVLETLDYVCHYG